MIRVQADILEDGPVRLRRALLVYENHNQAYVSEHPVDEKTNSLLPGTRFSDASLRGLFAKMGQGASFLDSRLVYAGVDQAVWFEPAQERVMFFETRDPFLNALSGRQLPQPPLVFIAAPSRLRVYALAHDERPAATTPLFIAPFYNVTGGNVCRGGARFPDRLELSDLSSYSDAFWESAFTHGTNQLLSKDFMGSYGELWRRAAETGRYPLETLRSADLSLRHAVEQT